MDPMVLSLVEPRMDDYDKAFRVGFFQACEDAVADVGAVVVEAVGGGSGLLPNSQHGRHGYQHLLRQTNHDCAGLSQGQVVHRRHQRLWQPLKASAAIVAEISSSYCFHSRQFDWTMLQGDCHCFPLH